MIQPTLRNLQLIYQYLFEFQKIIEYTTRMTNVARGRYIHGSYSHKPSSSPNISVISNTTISNSNHTSRAASRIYRSLADIFHIVYSITSFELAQLPHKHRRVRREQLESLCRDRNCARA